MAKLQLKYYPDDILKQKAKKITRFDASVRKLAADMLDTMYESSGVGLAAPQIGVSKRIMVIDVYRNDEDEGEVESKSSKKKGKPIIFINPQIIKKEGEMVGLEGCLSFPGVYFEVKRASAIVVRYQNLAGKELKIEAQGDLLCRAIQHEVDHLDGELFIDKAASPLVAELELSKHGFDSENGQQDHPESYPEEPTPIVGKTAPPVLIG